MALDRRVVVSTCMRARKHVDASQTAMIKLLKILWEKEKLLVTSNFSFSHNVFYSIWH